MTVAQLIYGPCVCVVKLNGEESGSIFLISHFLHNLKYEFEWQVSDREAKADGAFFSHNEKAEESNPGRVEGEYQVWLPDGR